jgi:shikimate kinase
LDPRSREYLKDRGFVIYLHAAPRELWRRTRHDGSRPLLQGGDPKGRLEELYARRDPLYRETADLVVETGRQSAGVLLGELLPSLEKVCGLST